MTAHPRSTIFQPHIHIHIHPHMQSTPYPGHTHPPPPVTVWKKATSMSSSARLSTTCSRDGMRPSARPTRPSSTWEEMCVCGGGVEGRGAARRGLFYL